jgi:hypothetical protein
MFGDEINAFVSLDLIYEHTEFLNPDLFRLLRMHLDHHFFKIEKRLVMTLLGIQLRATMRYFDNIIEEEHPGDPQSEYQIMPMRFYFDNSREILLRRPWAIDSIEDTGGHYYVNGVKISPETYPENDVFNGFPNWLHFGFSDHSRMGYCVNLVEAARAAPMDAAALVYKRDRAGRGQEAAKEHLRENMDFEETQITKNKIEEIVQ